MGGLTSKVCSPRSSWTSSPSLSSETVRSRQTPLSYGVESIQPISYLPTRRTVKCFSARGFLHSREPGVSRGRERGSRKNSREVEGHSPSHKLVIAGHSFWSRMQEEDIFDERSGEV